MSDTVRFGVIGAGAMGRIHAANLALIPGAELAAVSDLDRAAAEACAAANGVSAAFASERDLIALAEVDAIIIATPPETHAAIIEAAAAAGKHIFCEKPLERTLAAADRAIASADQAKVRLFVAFNRRYDPHYISLRDAVREGRVGKLLSVRMVARDPVEWLGTTPRPPGDLFLSTSIHEFDFVPFLLGEDVESVYATGGVMHDGPVLDDPDTALTTLRMASGAIAVIDNSRLSAYGYDQRLEVMGAGGMIEAANLAADGAPVTCSAALQMPKLGSSFAERWRESYVAELADFARSIREDAPSPISASDARRAQVLAHAAHESYVSGRPVAIADIG